MYSSCFHFKSLCFCLIFNKIFALFLWCCESWMELTKYYFLPKQSRRRSFSKETEKNFWINFHFLSLPNFIILLFKMSDSYKFRNHNELWTLSWDRTGYQRHSEHDMFAISINLFTQMEFTLKTLRCQLLGSQWLMITFGSMAHLEKGVYKPCSDQWSVIASSQSIFVFLEPPPLFFRYQLTFHQLCRSSRKREEKQALIRFVR